MAIQNWIIRGQDLLIAICKTLNIDESHVSRIIVDVAFDEAVKVYVEQYGDQKLLQVDWTNLLKNVDAEVISAKDME